MATGSVGRNHGGKAFQSAFGYQGSDDSSPDKDTRNLWTRATLSQPKLNVPRSKICDDSDAEGSSLGSKTRQWYSRKAGRESDGGWEEWEDGEDKDGFRREGLHEHLSLEMELRRGSILGSHLEEDVDSKTESGQCGLTGLWRSTGQGAGQEVTACRERLPNT